MTIAEMVNKYDIRKYDDATIVTCGLSSEDYAQKKPEIIANKLAILEYLNNESDGSKEVKENNENNGSKENNENRYKVTFKTSDTDYSDKYFKTPEEVYDFIHVEHEGDHGFYFDVYSWNDRDSYVLIDMEYIYGALDDMPADDPRWADDE